MHRLPPILTLDKPRVWPDMEEAIRCRDGLVAIGGDLSISRLLSAYQKGIFPWYSEGQPICWWALNPRMVLMPDNLKVSRSLRKNLRNKPHKITVNHCFASVIEACANTGRPNQDGTWITDAVKDAYIAMQQAGYAHSFECWYPDETGYLQLAGGLYGVQIGQVFYGESMFAWQSDASKMAFVQAVQFMQQRGVKIIDCQMHTEHLSTFGADEIKFSDFAQYLSEWCTQSLTQPIGVEVIEEISLIG